MARKFLVRKEGVTSFRELCSLNPLVIDYVNGREVWTRKFSETERTRFMDYWGVDRSVIQTGPPGFDGLVVYKLDESEEAIQTKARA